MAIPRTDDERNMVERIILYAMNDRTVLTNVGRAVENAYKTYMREIANEAKEDYKAFKKHIIDEINKRRAPVPERDIQDYLPHGGLPLGDPRYKGDRKRASKGREPRTEREEELVEDILMIARRDPSLKTNVERAVENAYNKYKQELIADIDDDFKTFKQYIIHRINPNLRGDRMATDNELRSKLIRLAHTNPELREQILPLVREANNGYNKAIKEIEQLIAFAKAFQALANDRKHGDFARNNTELIAGFIKNLNQQILQLDGAYQLGYTPMTRR